MTDEERTRLSTEAHADARRAMILSRIWWAMIPLVTAAYWMISKEPSIEKFLGCTIADVSFIANAVSYAGKAQGALARAAGYENP